MRSPQSKEIYIFHVLKFSCFLNLIRSIMNSRLVWLTVKKTQLHSFGVHPIFDQSLLTRIVAVTSGEVIKKLDIILSISSNHRSIKK